MTGSRRPIVVRREQPDDYGAIDAVHTAAFPSAPGAQPTSDAVTGEARLVRELRADGAAIAALSLVALIDATVVGHVMCSRGRVGDVVLAGLAPLGVRPEVHRHGVGTALMYAVLAAADALDEPAVVVLGDPGYYARFGFVPAESVGIRPTDPLWAPHFQVRTLTAYRDAVAGVFHYPSAFDRL